MDVATPEGWYRNPELVLDFTIKDANNSKEVQPIWAIRFLAELESF
jgi:NAD-dependent deacetylase